MGNPWFRFYHEWDSDPKVQMMSEAMQRRLAMLFCSQCKGGSITDNERAFAWRINEADLAETKALFMAKGFIDESWALLNWDRRQFLSDNSTERVRRHRSAKKQDETFHETDETLHETKCNALEQSREETELELEADTETDTDKKQKKQKPCATASAAPALDPDNGLPFTLPLINGTDWPVPADGCVEWAKAFPAVNVLEELRKMRVWLNANPTNRKTPNGVQRFVVKWLGRAQDAARPTGGNGNGYVNRGQARTDSNRENAIRAAQRMAARTANNSR